MSREKVTLAPASRCGLVWAARRMLRFQAPSFVLTNLASGTSGEWMRKSGLPRFVVRNTIPSPNPSNEGDRLEDEVNVNS